jgi:acyl-coenzyme A thioesterase PaaI-like protein
MMDYNSQSIAAEDYARMQDVFCNTGHNGELGLVYEGTGPGWLEYRLPWKETLVGEPGSGRIAPSVIYSLLDSSGALLPFYVLGRMVPYPTLQFRVDHYRQPEPGQDLIVRGVSERLTPDISFVRAIAHEGDPDDPVAIANGTYMSVRQLKK